MSTEAAKPPPQANVSIESVLGVQQHNLWQRIAAAQSFWVTVALIIICVVMSYLQPASFAIAENFYNITRNFSFIGIMALGMTAVIATGGIDLSVGSIMGLVAVASGLTLEAGYPVGRGCWSALRAGESRGPHQRTDHRLSRTCRRSSRRSACWRSRDHARWCCPATACSTSSARAARRSRIWAAASSRSAIRFSLSYPLLFLIVLTAILAVVYKMTSWGRHVLAIGGNEQAALLTGVPVNRVKVQVYVVSGLAAAVAAILNVGWSGSAINALGTSYELLAISAAVIGGANLMGGEASAYGAFIGAALIFVIRNSLLMAGIDSNWQGMFVGLFLIAAVYLGKIRGAKRE